MARMLGDSILPDSIQDRRRSMRRRLRELRQPIRERRQSLVPGPDLIGSVEQKLDNVRTNLSTRDSLMQRIRDSRLGGSDGSSNGGNGGSNGNNDEAQVQQNV